MARGGPFDLNKEINKALSPKRAFSAAAVESLYVFLKEANFEIDRRLIDPDKFYWLGPLYDIKRSELFGQQLSDGTWLVRPKYEAGILYRKASQMGASVWSIVFMLWLCIDEDRPLGIACYWPTEKDLQDFVQTRLDPMLEGNEKMKSLMEDTKVDSTRAKQILNSTIYFRYVAGKASADSIPVDVVIGDEIRLWDTPAETLQRLDERMGQSVLKLRVYMSTVGSPNDFMEQQWFASNQTKWYSRCPENDCYTEVPLDPRAPRPRMFKASNLVDADPSRPLIRGVVLSDFLPTEIVKKLEGVRNAVYVCPCCGGEIPRPSDGEYVATYPDSEGMYALEFARTLSMNATPWMLLSQFLTAKDMKQFMNGWMAKPWLDPEGRPVREEHWEHARKVAAELGLEWEQWGSGTYLGGDFRANEFHWIIGEKDEYEHDGRVYRGRVVAFGVYQGSDWELEADRLLRQYGVERAVIDYLPFTTATLKFAKRHEGVVYLAQYKGNDLLKTPAENGKSKRRVSPDARENYMVNMDQVKSLAFSLNSFAMGHWLVPQGPLYQRDYIDRRKNVHAMFDVTEGMEGEGREGLKQHLMCLALINKYEDTKNDSGERVTVSGKMTQEFVDAGGFDPHWAHAFNYMVAASELGGDGARILRPDPALIEAAERGTLRPGVQLGMRNPLGLPIPLPVAKAGQSCGNCKWFPHEEEGERAHCGALGWEVGRREPACSAGLWRPKS